MAYQWRVDPDGTQGYNWVSPRSIDIFGVDPADLILNWSLVGIHPEDSQRWQDTIQISIAEMSEWSFLGRYIPPDQRPRWIHCVSRPVRQLDGSIIFYGVGIDVSKQRDLEQRILQAAAEEARANAANKAKSDFLALISHELRTPLNAIRNYTTLIREELEDIGHLTLQDDLNKISFANDHLLSIITNVLDLSKIEAGKLELLIEEVPIVKFVASLVELIRPLCEENANLFETSFDLARETAMFDQTHIRQALMNLLGNAAKFTRNGRISLRVSDTHNMLVFEVEDTGIGMTNEQMMRLFQPFTQADATISRNFGGTGLGLTLSKYFVSAMGGEIDVHSILGHGSRFTVRLPQPA
jgi:signal transduction histidine kinase